MANDGIRTPVDDEVGSMPSFAQGTGALADFLEGHDGGGVAGGGGGVDDRAEPISQPRRGLLPRGTAARETIEQGGVRCRQDFRSSVERLLKRDGLVVDECHLVAHCVTRATNRQQHGFGERTRFIERDDLAAIMFDGEVVADAPAEGARHVMNKRLHRLKIRVWLPAFESQESERRRPDCWADPRRLWRKKISKIKADCLFLAISELAATHDFQAISRPQTLTLYRDTTEST